MGQDDIILDILAVVLICKGNNTIPQGLFQQFIIFWKLKALILFYIFILSSTSMHSHASSVRVLFGSNYSEQLTYVQFILGVLDFDLVLFIERITELINESIVEQINETHTWKRSNSLSLMFIIVINHYKCTRIFEGYRFKSIDKSLINTLMKKLTTTQYDDTQGI